MSLDEAEGRQVANRFYGEAADMPRFDRTRIGRKQAIAFLRDYLAYDPCSVDRATTMATAPLTPSSTHFDGRAVFFTDDEVASRGIRAARTSWGLRIVGVDSDRVGGLWVVDED